MKQIVKNLLKQRGELRDDDRRLVMWVWWYQIPAIRQNNMSAKEMMMHIVENPKKVDSWDNITRMRRKLQEEDPSLRGNKYEHRHSKAERIRTEVGQQNTLKL